MRVKIGNQWFAVTPEQPIMVVLTKKDRQNIADMPEFAKLYACFDNADTEHANAAAKEDWMLDGLRPDNVKG